MSRERLPERRGTTTFEVEHSGFRYTVSYSAYADGRVAEVFIDPAKRGSELTVIAHDAAVITSIALQHGASLETIVGALARDGDEKPASPIGAVLHSVAASEKQP